MALVEPYIILKSLNNNLWSWSTMKLKVVGFSPFFMKPFVFLLFHDPLKINKTLPHRVARIFLNHTLINFLERLINFWLHFQKNFIS